jgi:hypothetical protein
MLITFVPRSYTSGPFPWGTPGGKLVVGDGMSAVSVGTNRRRGNRSKAVLPVRVKGKDSAGNTFEDLVHTLDVTSDGVRLGSLRRELNALEEVTVFYRQRKIQFRVIWTKKMKGTSEFQVGLQALAQEGEAWGLSFPDFKRQPASQSEMPQASGVV